MSADAVESVAPLPALPLRILPAASSPLEIIDTILKSRSVTHEQLVGPSRERWVYLTRVLVAKALRALPGMSLTSIGKILNKDHTTVLYYVRRP